MKRTRRTTPPPAAAFAGLQRSAQTLIASTRETALARAQAARRAAEATAAQARERTLSAVTRLEKVFEQRVSQVIAKLGVPTARDVHALTRQVERLEQSVERLRRSRAGSRSRARA
ncbi:MAG TPA: phasin family protein [Usitatibacter sp.]|nr:phasin family protein [Usitatibacter sp.]